MKNDVSRRYRTRVITNIIYSAIITCLVEVFFVTNLSMVARYMGNKGKMVLMVQAIEKQHTAVVLLYLIPGDPAVFHYIYDPSGTLYPLYQ